MRMTNRAPVAIALAALSIASWSSRAIAGEQGQPAGEAAPAESTESDSAASNPLAPQAEAGGERAVYDHIVALKTRVENDTRVATAFFVADGDANATRDANAGGDVFLVTAKHAADETTARTRVLYRAPNGDSRWIELRGLFPGGRSPWVPYGSVDVAVARVDPPRESDDREGPLAMARRLALPLDSLATEPPPRGTPLEAVGYPVGLGADPPISSLVMHARTASRVVWRDGGWSRIPTLYAFPAIGAGTSGGPAFHAETGQLVGMVRGVTFDNTGGKLSELVPAFAIRAAIAEAATAR